MSGKTRITAALAVWSLAACTAVRETPAPPATNAAAVTDRATAPQPAPKPATAKPKPRATPLPAANRTARTAAPAAPQPTAAIQGSVSREPGGQSVLVTRGHAAEPVPLFRQAIVLANVRAAVAGLPAPPKAEFQRGLLTLTFPRGNQTEITTAINKALTVPEVTRLRAIVAP